MRDGGKGISVPLLSESRQKLFSVFREIFGINAFSILVLETAPILSRPRKKGAFVTGLDISEAMFEVAAQRAAAVGASVEWLRASAESLPFDSGTFNVALAVIILWFSIGEA